MNIIEISAAGSCAPTLAIGKRGENLATEIRFDFSSWLEEFGEGRVELYARRCGDENAYPVTVTVDGTTAVWTLTATDTHVVGYGTAEFVWVAGETVVKSVVFGTIVEPDIGQPTDTPPEPYESWLDTLTELAADTQEYAERAETAEEAAETAQRGAEAAQAATEEALGPIAKDVSELKETVDVTIGVTARGLPEGYTESWYIETDGAVNIDTGISWATPHPRVVIDALCTGGTLFGQKQASSRHILGGAGIDWEYGPKQVDASETAAYVGTRHVFDFSQTFLKIDGTTIKTFDATGATGSQSTIKLFYASGTSSQPTVYAAVGTRIYAAKIYRDINNVETLVFDGVPCVRNTDGVIGFYDLVGENFNEATAGTPKAIGFPNLIENTVNIDKLQTEIVTKQDKDYTHTIDWYEVFANDDRPLGWGHGYYNSTGQTASSTASIRTSSLYRYIAKAGETRIVFTGPEGTHARIVEWDADGTFLRYVGNLSTGAKTQEITLTEGHQYAFCLGNATPSGEDVTPALVASITATVTRTVSSRDEEQDAEIRALRNSLNVGMFNSIGVCGYSWDSGYAYSNYSGSIHVYTRRSRSWGAVLSNMYGIDYACYGVPSGTTCAPDSPWIGTSGAVCWQTAEYGLPKLLNDDPCDLYWFHLFGNDWKKLGDDYLGTIADITDDYTQNPDTFFGNYGRIVEQIKAHAPNALFVFSYRIPDQIDGTQKSFADALLEIAEHYGVPTINWYDDAWFYRWVDKHLIESHPTFVDYAGMAKAADRLFGRCVEDNWEYFRKFVPAADPTE